MKRLPIGIQTFREIIEGGYVYIDKTKYVLELIENYKYVFLSRPRRFGKSLLLDTIKEAFEGNRELFKGLYIYDKYDFSKYPVIKISWAGNLRSLEGIKSRILFLLEENQDRLGIRSEFKSDPASFFAEIIAKAYKKYKERVVVLIDEYDKPILDNIDKVGFAKEVREFLRGFYGIIKDSDEYIRFAMLTGVSRFSKVSIFSGINNLTDISLQSKFNNICGYLEENLLREFGEYFSNAGVDLEEVRKWYNGYNFGGRERVYNPFDILLFIDNDFEFKNYWFSTGTPSFLIKLLQEREFRLIDFENLEVDERILNSFDIEKIELETVLFQTGYLTIKKKEKFLDDTFYILSYPNKEVRKSFNDYVLDYLVERVSTKTKIQINLYKVLLLSDLDRLEGILRALFKSIPYNNFVKNQIARYEGFYASVLYAYFTGAGFDVIAEDTTNDGRVDLTVILGKKVYLFEFKVYDEEPLKQVIEKKYYEKYMSYEEVYGVGIKFNNETRNIDKYLWLKFK